MGDFYESKTGEHNTPRVGETLMGESYEQWRIDRVPMVVPHTYPPDIEVTILASWQGLGKGELPSMNDVLTAVQRMREQYPTEKRYAISGFPQVGDYLFGVEIW